MYRDYWGCSEEPKEIQSGGQSSEEPKIIERKEPAFLEIVKNRIYFYSEIDRDKVLVLTKKLRELNNDLLLDQKTFNLKEKFSIYLHINSYGGSIFSGLACMDSILQSDIPVITIVDGACASAATFLSIVGKERFINQHAYMLIHQLSSAMWGKYEEFKDEMSNLDKLMSIIKEMYERYTKIPTSKLEEILKHDLWFDPETCLEYGLVDKIIT